MFNPRLSIITIVYNNVNDIERTILSVLGQTYTNIEYIVIDGASTDGTLDVIEKYRSRISTLVSEKDNGIYNAMNKGLNLATGDYVLFMNSGDELFAYDTVERVFATEADADIYYGETEIINSKRESMGMRRHKTPETFTWRGFNLGMSISHQAIYIKRSLVEPYNEQYQLSADIDWIIRIAKKADKIVNTRICAAKYLFGGMSKKKHKQSLIERFHIMRKHYGTVPTVFNHGIIAIRLTWYFLLNRKTND
ncbi:glycosyltransferase involved in cell wall biosynthesis [Mucilaginibacter gracilis]|uniref:Glycosyltransferase involved in cell wall biosynthesis n=1 Tax=Mucilaginibacter gracilis TaxID=423350 RepID=A0A495IVV5_9SPHI|nr:glycosyltransferase family 2 protein [Mucilaginibacter gracilis]RKR80885.1 glycosyltransferase involved in cell wall biosynthesis [Mucilaginibacter gracilis]